MGPAVEGHMVKNLPVTVLMAVYDPPPAMLDRAVESVLAQTFGDFEFLILDDGSRDEAVRAGLDSWASRDRRVRLYHEPHRGVPAACNRGLSMARGDLIARHDADDWSEPERLAQQACFLVRHPEVTLVSTDTESHSADGELLWRLRLPHASDELARALRKGNPFVHGSTMFRRRMALAIGGYREAFPCSSDYDFLWRLTEAGRAVNLDQVLYHYRYTGGSISARKAAGQVLVHRATQMLAAARRTGEIEDVQAALAAASVETSSKAFRALLKQADHVMLAGDFSGAQRAYFEVLRSHSFSGLAWAKIFRLAVFWAIPPAREACFR
jgi:glycosyltransferase involved in cell wall biosynthesis